MRKPIENKKFAYFDDEKYINKLTYLLNNDQFFGNKNNNIEIDKNVCLLFSGGLDSTTALYILLENTKSKILPLFFINSHSYNKYENRVVDRIIKIATKKYPNRLYPMEKVKVIFPISPLKIDYEKQVLCNESYSSLYALYCCQFLRKKEQLSKTYPFIRQIIMAMLFSDGHHRLDQTETNLLATELSLRAIYRDNSWKFSSLFLDKKRFSDYYHWGKKDLVRWSSKINVPISLTRSSCNQSNNWRHCGNCTACYVRKNAFIEAKVIDKTRYIYSKKFVKNLSKKELSKINLVEGWLTPIEVIKLYESAQRAILETSINKICEIGSYKGKSTVILAKVIKNHGSGKLISVDPHENTYTQKTHNSNASSLPDLKKNITKFKLKTFVEIVQDYSSAYMPKLLDESFALIFIDGDHEYRQVARDFEISFKKTSWNGYIAMHDALNILGPRKIMINALKNPNLIFCGLYGDLAIFRKKRFLSIKNWLKKIYSFIVINLFFYFYRPDFS